MNADTILSVKLNNIRTALNGMHSMHTIYDIEFKECLFVRAMQPDQSDRPTQHAEKDSLTMKQSKPIA